VLTLASTYNCGAVKRCHFCILLSSLLVIKRKRRSYSQHVPWAYIGQSRDHSGSYRNLYDHRNATFAARQPLTALAPLSISDNSLYTTHTHTRARSVAVSHIMTFYWTTQSVVASTRRRSNTLPFDMSASCATAAPANKGKVRVCY